MVQPPNGSDTLIHDTVVVAPEVYLVTSIDNPVWFPEIFDWDSAVAYLRYASPADSIQTAPDDFQTRYRESIFYTEHRPINTFNQPITNKSHTVIRSFSGVVLIIALLLVVIIKLAAQKKAWDYLMAIFNQKRFQKFMNEEEPGWGPPMPLMIAVSSMVTGTVISSLFIDPTEFSSPVTYIIASTGIILLTFLFPFVRSAGIQFVGSIFKIQPYTILHNNITYLSLVLLGLLMLPIFLAIGLGWPVEQEMLRQGMSVAATVVFIGHFTRMLWQLRTGNWFYIFNFFLYFCTLEIVPLLFGYKLYLLAVNN